MTHHSEIHGRFGKQQVARFLTEVACSGFVVTSTQSSDIYKVYAIPKVELSFSGPADDVMEFLDQNQAQH